MSCLNCLRFAFVGQHFSCACHPPTLLIVKVHNDIRGGGVLWSLIITACDETWEPAWTQTTSQERVCLVQAVLPIATKICLATSNQRTYLCPMQIMMMMMMPCPAGTVPVQ